MGMLRQTKVSKQKPDHVVRVKVARNRVSDCGRVYVCTESGVATLPKLILVIDALTLEGQHLILESVAAPIGWA